MTQKELKGICKQALIQAHQTYPEFANKYDFEFIDIFPREENRIYIVYNGNGDSYETLMEKEKDFFKYFFEIEKILIQNLKDIKVSSPIFITNEYIDKHLVVGFNIDIPYTNLINE